MDPKQKELVEEWSHRLVEGEQVVDRGSTYSVLSAMPLRLRKQQLPQQPRIISSSCSCGERAVSEKLDSVVLQLRQVTRERDELRKRLALSSPGTTFDDCRKPSRTARGGALITQMECWQCMKAMADLQSLQNQHTQTLKKCEEAMKEADFYHTLHGRVLMNRLV
ncbi:hypothetical protein SRHO_G00153740 [Serrasalmus rhombeus]